MKYLAQSFSRPASVLVLAVALMAAVSAQSVPPSGSFGYLLNVFLSPQSTDSGTAFLGVMNFDGAGNVTGSYNFQRGATSSKSAKTSTGTFTGTYSSKPDGTGSVTVAFDAGLTVTLTVVITDSGNGLQLVATNLMGGDISGSVVSGFARAAYAGSPQGSYGFQLNNSPVPAGIIGVATFDGAGNVAVSFTTVFVGQDPSLGFANWGRDLHFCFLDGCHIHSPRGQLS